MEFHEDKIKAISFHNNYPLLLSSSRNGQILVYHTTVYNDLVTDPLIVPLKALQSKDSKGKVLLKVLLEINNAVFHPKHSWIFSCGEDGLIRKWI
jgi:ribosome biogenesis protein ERB1